MRRPLLLRHVGRRLQHLVLADARLTDLAALTGVPKLQLWPAMLRAGLVGALCLCFPRLVEEQTAVPEALCLAGHSWGDRAHYMPVSTASVCKSYHMSMLPTNLFGCLIPSYVCRVAAAHVSLPQAVRRPATGGVAGPAAADHAPSPGPQRPVTGTLILALTQVQLHRSKRPSVLASRRSG